MSQNPQTPSASEVKIVDNIPGAEYTNAMQVTHNKDEFQLIFLNIMAGSGRVCGKLISSPGHFKRMINALQDNLKKYEGQFGTIEEASAPSSKEIGFNV